MCTALIRVVTEETVKLLRFNNEERLQSYFKDRNIEVIWSKIVDTNLYYFVINKPNNNDFIE